MNKIIKKLFGIDKIEDAISAAETRMHQAVDETAAQQREAERARQAAPTMTLSSPRWQL